jgi:hypothetical protein
MAPFASPDSAAGQERQGFSDQEFDPNFVMGKVVAAGEDGTLSVVDLDDRLRTLRSESASRFWKAGGWNGAEIAPNDCIWARGQLEGDSGLAVENLWANMVNLRGELRSVLGDTLSLAADNGELFAVAATPKTTVVGPTGEVLEGVLSLLAIGEYTMVIGYRDPASKELTATRVESFAALDEVSPESTVEAADMTAAFTVARRGNASWFCCGNVSGCGHCGASNQGYCGGNGVPERPAAYGVAAGVGMYGFVCGLLPGQRLSALWVRHQLRYPEPVFGAHRRGLHPRLRSQPALSQHGLPELRLGALRPHAVRVQRGGRQLRDRTLQPARQPAAVMVEQRRRFKPSGG